MALLFAIVLVFLPPANAGNQCVFCDDNYTYNLQSLPSATFLAYSGTPGSTTDLKLNYLVSSPCSVPKSDLCIGGPTSDPLALQGNPPHGEGIIPECTGMGTLNSTYGAAKITSRGALGFTLSLRGRNQRITNFNFVCNNSAPVNNPPELKIVTSESAHFHLWNVTWHHPSVCNPKRTVAGECVISTPSAPPTPACEACLPPWKPTWNMSRSTALYGCNDTGTHNVAEAIAYGITVYDWSHAKLEWVNSHPMDDDAKLTQQAEKVLAADPGVPGEQPRVWVYRNKIKALNWYGQVREKLDDPQYSGWFVKFSNYKGVQSNNSYHVPACDWYGDNISGPPKCSQFYHDQGQSPTHLGAGPAYCRAAKDLNNVCREQCDCGPINPCGEYTFDHRNDSFVDWWINGYMISNLTLLRRPMINLGWLDDGIGLNGVSESAPPGTWAMDTGSTPLDMQDHYDAFRTNIAKLQRAVIEHGGFYWQMIQGRGPKVRPVLPHHSTCHEPKVRQLTAEQCSATLRQWCAPDPEPWRQAHLYAVCADEMVNATIARDATAEFLLTRGDFAWIGYSWAGCFPMPVHQPWKPNWLRPRPKLWDMNYGGRPDGPCRETGNNTGVFVRNYPLADVQWDCNSGSGTIQLHK